MYQVTTEFPQTMHLFKIGDKVGLSPIKHQNASSGWCWKIEKGENTGDIEITNEAKKFSTRLVANLIGPRVLLSDFLVKL